jgi:3-hydroxyisobutyrate dehydrogenase
MVEGLRMAAAGGLDPETTLRVMSGGAAGSWMLINLGAKILAGDFAPGFRIQLQQKDLRLAAEWDTATGHRVSRNGIDVLAVRPSA